MSGRPRTNPTSSRGCAALDQLFGLGHGGAVRAHKQRGDVLCTAFGEQLRPKRAVLLINFDRCEQCRQQAFAVLRADVVGGRRINPFGGNLRPAQHPFDHPAALIRDDERRCPLAPGAAGAARSVLQCLGIAGQLDMDDQREIGQIDAARGHIGRHAHPRAAIAQRLKSCVAFVLAMLT